MKTKEKILKAAGQLFSQKGYAASSIREISKQCDVNIAAVNYHFNSKENLFHSVVKDHYQFLDQEISRVCENASCIEECAIGIFRLFILHGDKVMMTFKFLMNESIEIEKSVLTTSSGSFGPPGNDQFIALIKRCRPSINNQDAFFVMRNILSIICHQSLILSSKAFGQHLKNSKAYNLQSHEASLKRLTCTLLGSLDS